MLQKNQLIDDGLNVNSFIVLQRGKQNSVSEITLTCEKRINFDILKTFFLRNEVPK